jgi:hypothetical protein
LDAFFTQDAVVLSLPTVRGASASSENGFSSLRLRPIEARASTRLEAVGDLPGRVKVYRNTSERFEGIAT